MKFGYKLNRLMGSVYGHGLSTEESCAPNVVFTPDGNSILSPIGNRINVVDLVNTSVRTLTPQSRKNIRHLALSHSGKLLLSIDEDGRGLFINMTKGLPVHRVRFKGKVRAAAFSPDDRWFALAVGQKLQIWRTPGLVQEFAPLALEKQLAGGADDLTCLAWAPDSDHILVGSRDLSARLLRRAPPAGAGWQAVALSGHRGPLVSVAFLAAAPPPAAAAAAAAAPPEALCTVAKDGALFLWRCDDPAAAAAGEDGEEGAPRKKQRRRRGPARAGAAGGGGRAWRLERKEFLKPSPGSFAKVKSCAFHAPTGLLVAGFSTGVFGLWKLPEVALVHALSVGRAPLRAVAVAPGGAWLALGASRAGQLLVWEWQAEAYVLKQQGHAHGLRCVAYAPDGRHLATGGEDGKVKLWSAQTGFCFVTFEEHQAPISAVLFAQSGRVVLSASLDGTVRAHDLGRYKCFRTLVAPGSGAQLLSLAVDAGGELVAAGALEPPEVYVWSLQTGKLLDVLPGHAGPVCAAAFAPAGQTGRLATASWDGQVKLWDVYKAKALESLEHDRDVLDAAWRPDGKQLCAACLNGNLYFWNPETAEAEGVIEGRRDVAGGRGANDVITAKTKAAQAHFTRVTYTADGQGVLAGGEGKYVCLYAARTRVLVRKFQLSLNRNYDGVLDELNSQALTDSGAAREAMDVSGSEDEDDDGGRAKRAAAALPGATRGMGRSTRAAVRCTSLAFGPAGRAWAAATPDGVLVYDLDGADAAGLFDPFELDEAATPAAARRHLREGRPAQALLVALHLGEHALQAEVLDGVGPEDAAGVAAAVPAAYAPRLLQALARRLGESAHLEFHLRWLRGLLAAHGPRLRADRAGAAGPALRAAQKAVLAHRDALARLAHDNAYLLRFLARQRPAALGGAEGEGDGEEGGRRPRLTAG